MVCCIPGDKRYGCDKIEKTYHKPWSAECQDSKDVIKTEPFEGAEKAQAGRVLMCSNDDL